jgi:hypothetical protein
MIVRNSMAVCMRETNQKNLIKRQSLITKKCLSKAYWHLTLDHAKALNSKQDKYNTLVSDKVTEITTV